MYKGTIGLFLVAGLLAGCGSSKYDAHKKAAHATPVPLFYSPNGEPLNGGPLGQPACKDAMSRWFDRVDTNHDGAISLQEFLADADIQFRRMDIDHNGYIVSEELERFRKPYREQSGQQTADNNDNASNNDNNQAKASGHKHSGKRGQGSADQAQNTPPPESADPVMSADANMDFEVTPQEFAQHASEVFAEMNISHNGSLSRDEAIARCPKAP